LNDQDNSQLEGVGDPGDGEAKRNAMTQVAATSPPLKVSRSRNNTTAGAMVQAWAKEREPGERNAIVYQNGNRAALIHNSRSKPRLT
jgi:hypothetical protein